MFLLAERMRNAGKFTIADVLAFRLRERPARTAAAIGTLAVVAFYLIAQMVGAGVLIQALVGIDFTLAVILTGAFMLCYVVFGGMVATTWVQIIKAVLLMTGIAVMSIFVLGKVGFNPIELFNRAEANTTAESTFSLGPGTFLASPIDTVSLGLALVLGTAGLPHILMRFFTVPDAKAARGSVVWAMFLIGFFYLLTTFIGFGARAFLGEAGVEAAGTGGNLAAPNLAEFLGGGEGTFGGDLFLAVIAGVAFATILAVVAGLVLSASAAVAHDVWSNIVRKGKDSEKEEVWVAKIAAISIGAIAIVVAIIGGAGLNVSFMVGLAFAVAASANFPALLLALTWRRFNTTGAVTGVLFGVISSIALVIVSPKVWPGADTVTGSPVGWDLANPGIVSIPLGFIGCWLGTMLTHGARRRAHVPRAVRPVGDRAGRREGRARARRALRPQGVHNGGGGRAVAAPSLRTERGATAWLKRRSRPSWRSCWTRRPSRRRASSPQHAVISDPAVYEEAERDPEGFWAEQAEALHWDEKWDTVLDWSEPAVRQVVRRAASSTSPTTASTGTSRPATATASRSTGAARRARSATSRTPTCTATSSASPTRSRTAASAPGDVVGIFLPMIPEVAVAMLACARIGAPHNVVFGGFSPESVKERMEFSEAKALITVDGARRKGKTAPIKQQVDEVMGDLDHLETIIVVQHTGAECSMQEGRDFWWHDASWRPPTTSARPSRWTPSTRSSSSTRAARRPSRRGSCTPPAAT